MELVSAPHHELPYEGARDIHSFKAEDLIGGDKLQACLYARATGMQETGMSPNEIGLLYDLLGQKPQHIVELGRNFACSSRLFIHHVLNYGGFLESWDLKHWTTRDGLSVRETFVEQGFDVADVPGTEDYTLAFKGRPIALMKCADTIIDAILPKTPFVDFLLIDTEHGIEDALGEYMRWRRFCRGGAVIAFHDSELPAVARSIDICVEVEMSNRPDRIVKRVKNERIEGFGLEALVWA